jgi:hypothetical protein
MVDLLLLLLLLVLLLVCCVPARGRMGRIRGGVVGVEVESVIMGSGGGGDGGGRERNSSVGCR